MKRTRPDADDAWTKAERKLLDRLKTPMAIQCFLEGAEYSAESTYRSPRQVLHDCCAHCTDGALFAAAALRRLGDPPLIMDLRAVRDDDHLVAVFRRDGRLGAVAKSNFSGLRYREPVYRSLRELAMSYFDGFFNVEGERTLREYSALFSLARFDRLHWMTDTVCLDYVITRLDASRHYPIAPRRIIAKFEKVDERSYRAGMLGVKEEGLWRP
jgi:hypothetical protein